MSTGTELSTLLTTYLHNDVSLTAATKLIYLNLGLKKILRDAPLTFYKKEETLNLTAVAGREYDLESDFYLMVAMWETTTGRKLAPTLTAEWIEGIERLTTVPSGPPEQYIILGFDESETAPAWRIRFDKTPDDSYTVTYWYIPMPEAITADATPAISSMGFDELLLWSSTCVALQPKDPQGHQIAYQNYRDNLSKWFEYRAMSPDYTPRLRSWDDEYRPGLRLPSNFPSY